MAYRRISLLLIGSLLALSGGAAELGEPRVSSWRGQALVADIELSSLDDPAAPVHVRVASPDVYRGASVSVPALLSALTLSVVRKDGKQFVHVASSRPVDTEMLLLFLELGQGAQKDVRLATLWLTADPRPAPPPPPPPPVAVAPALAPVSAPVPAVAPPVLPPLPLHLARVSTNLPASLRPAPPGACKASASNSACAILDKKNVALQAKLVGLEDKIKLLQATLAHNLRQESAERWTWKYDPRTLSERTTAEILEPRQALWARLSTVTCPTLVIRGADSEIFAPADAERFTRALPHGRCVTVPAARHSVQTDNPKGLAAAVEAIDASL